MVMLVIIGFSYLNNNGNTTVDGKDSAGTEINGDKAIVNNDGDSTILDGGTGTRITGDDATANNSGNTTCLLYTSRCV